ncbi:MAG: phage late control D family protein [Candidatus Rokuibacteriota bacterium]
MPATPATADRLFAASIRINGTEDEDFYQCIAQITVVEDLDRGSSFSIRVDLHRNEDGTWPHLDEARFEPWNRITIAAAFPDHADVIMDGYITHAGVGAEAQGGKVTMEIRGADASYVMHLEEKCKVWKEKTYEAIAEEIIKSYGLKAVLPEGGAAAGNGTPPPSVTQRGTDHRFLRELARRKGYEFYVRGGDAHFHPADLAGTPQKVIAAEFGNETNCAGLSLEMDGTRPTEIVMSRLDPLAGVMQTVTAISSELEPLGTRDIGDMRGFGIPSTLAFVRNQGAATEADMTDFTRGVLRRHGWWVSARGSVNGLVYGRVLRSRKLVTIKGYGPTYNGNYYVRKVTHKLEPRSYVMEFEAARNRVGKLGTEPFEGENPEAAELPAALGAGADTDRVVVAETGAQVAPA